MARPELTGYRAPWQNASIEGNFQGLDAETMMQKSGLDWKAIEAPMHTNWRSPDGTVVQETVEGYKRLVRNMGDKRVTLGIHKSGYATFQPYQAFQFANDLREGGRNDFQAAGSFRQGRVIWLQAALPQADFEVTPGDKNETSLTVVTSYDGSFATQGYTTTTRIVCWNTFLMSIANAAAKVKIKHTVGASIKLQEAQKYLTGAILTAEAMKEKLRILASRRMTKESLTSIIDKLFPKSSDPETIQTRRENTVREILGLYESNDNNTFPDQRGTAYNLFNAITNYADHTRATKRTDKTVSEEFARSESAMFGSGAKLKDEALELILVDTKGNPVQPERRHVDLGDMFSNN